MNHRNRLATASVGGTQVGAYVYDALERLAIRTTSNVTPAGTTHFAYDLAGRVLVEANGTSGATVREYIWFDDMPLAIMADADTATPSLLHVHADHLNRPIMLTNAAKANVWEAVYRPYGQVHSLTGAATQNLRFPGQYFLFETGLAHNWHRTYDPTIGRYLQPDPLGLIADGQIIPFFRIRPELLEVNRDGASVFSYSASSPIVNIDRYGLITAREHISLYCNAGVLRVFPGQFLECQIEEIIACARAGDAAARTAKKLLFDRRFRR